MARATMTIEKREADGGSPVARRLRKTGRVPGIVYHDKGNVPFDVDELEAGAVFRKGATLIDVTLDGKTQLTVLKEYQLHPLRGTLQHIDLQAVSMDQTVRTTASLTLVGEAPGIKAGGILQQGTREVLIECTAAQIPDTIEYDISNVNVGDTVILKEVPAPEGITFLDDPGQMVIAMTVPRGAKGGAADAEGDADADGAEGEAAEGSESDAGGDES